GMLGFVSSGAERWRIDETTLSARVNGGTIAMSVANGGMNITSNLTTATDDRYGIRITNTATPTLSSGSQRLLEARFPVNMSGTAGYTVLDVVAAETATGSGEKWLLSGKSGAGGTTRVFGVTNAGQVLTGGGSAAAPAVASVADPASGLYFASNVTRW